MEPHSLNLRHSDRAGDGPQKTGLFPSNRLLTVKQAAAQTQISVRQLRRMIKTGALPVKRFGKAVRIHPKHLGL